MKMFKKNYWMKLLPLVCAGVMIFGVSFAGALTPDDVTNLYGADVSATSLVEAMRLADKQAPDTKIIESLVKANSGNAAKIVEIYGMANPDNLSAITQVAISAVVGLGGGNVNTQVADILASALQAAPQEQRQQIVDAAVAGNPEIGDMIRETSQPMLASVGQVGTETESQQGQQPEGGEEAFEPAETPPAANPPAPPAPPETGGGATPPPIEPPPVASDKPASPV